MEKGSEIYIYIYTHTELAHSVGKLGSVPQLQRSLGEGNGYPLQDSCQENSMDRGAWRVTVHGVTKSRTRLSNSHSHFTPLGELATPFSTNPCLLLPLTLINIFLFFFLWNLSPSNIIYDLIIY